MNYSGKHKKTLKYINLYKNERFFHCNGFIYHYLCISKINSTLIDNAEDLNIALSRYSLLEYSDNYSMKSGS